MKNVINKIPVVDKFIVRGYKASAQGKSQNRMMGFKDETLNFDARIADYIKNIVLDKKDTIL